MGCVGSYQLPHLPRRFLCSHCWSRVPLCSDRQGEGKSSQQRLTRESKGKLFYYILMQVWKKIQAPSGAPDWFASFGYVTFCFASKKTPTNPLHFLSRIQGDFRALQFEFQRKDLLSFIYSYTAALISESNNVWNHLNHFLFSTWIYQEERIYLKWA